MTTHKKKHEHFKWIVEYKVEKKDQCFQIRHYEIQYTFLMCVPQHVVLQIITIVRVDQQTWPNKHQLKQLA